MDKSLDDIIQSKPRKGNGRRRGGGGPKAQALGSRAGAAAAAATRARKISNVKPATIAPQQIAEKIMVSGLPFDVNEAQIKDLFTGTVGAVKDIHLIYNSNGKWSGSATVVFAKKGDGSKAYELYNNRLIDGRKPMKIELMFDPAKAPPAPLLNRVTPAPRPAGGAAPMEGVQRSGGRPRRGRVGGRAKRAPKVPKTAEDLDAEMEDYSAATNQPAAAAPAA